MQSVILQNLLSGTWRDPDTGNTVNVPTHDIRIDTGLISRADTLFSPYTKHRSIALVTDQNTWDAAGKIINDTLKVAHSIYHIMLPKGVSATQEHVQSIREQTANCSMIVGVGSGTINDLCKYASFLDQKPYVIFGTAPSMNGYASANASITVDGEKYSLPARLPDAIFLDLDVLSHAPLRLIQSGIGDSLCRPTCQADWLLSHYLLDTPYSSAPFTLLAGCESMLYQNIPAIIARDHDAMRHLAHTLIFSGIGMYLSGGSYPASQGEHLLAHYVEMRYGKHIPDHYHGEHIAVTTLIMSELQESLLSQKKLKIHTPTLHKDDVVRHFGEHFAENIWPIIEEKQTHHTEIRECLTQHWPHIRQSIQNLVIPNKTLHTWLEQAGAPTDYIDLGWTYSMVEDAMAHAHCLRNRFTFLDLAAYCC